MGWKAASRIVGVPSLQKGPTKNVKILFIEAEDEEDQNGVLLDLVLKLIYFYLILDKLNHWDQGCGGLWGGITTTLGTCSKGFLSTFDLISILRVVLSGNIFSKGLLSISSAASSLPTYMAYQ